MRILGLTLATVAGFVAITTQHHAHHRRPLLPSAVEADTLRAGHVVSRSLRRQPLPRRVKAAAVTAKARPHSLMSVGWSSHDLRGVATVADVTMYCSTGHRNAVGRWPRIGDVATLDRRIPFGARVRIAGRLYVVADRIGSGSQFDIFGGNDADCEQRALTFGRQHLRVVVGGA